MKFRIVEGPKRKRSTSSSRERPVKDRERDFGFTAEVPPEANMATTQKQQSRSSSSSRQKMKFNVSDKIPVAKLKNDPDVRRLLNQYGQDIMRLGGDTDFQDLIDAGVDIDALNVLSDEIEEIGYIPEIPEITQTDLPAVIQWEIERTGGGINPKWYQVKRLPGYFRNAIRTIGRAVFKPFTDVPIEEIYCVTTLTNNDAEVNAVVNWITKNGKEDHSAKLEFTDKIPGYEAEAKLWHCSGYQFVIVRDFAGYYVYGFVGKDQKYLDPVTKRFL